MRIVRTASRSFGITIFALTALTASRAMAQTLAAPAEQAVAAMQAEAGGTLATRVSPATHVVTFLSVPAGRALRLPSADKASASDRALAFLLLHGPAFGVDRTDRVSVTRVAGPDALGMEHVRLRQLVDGVPVTGAELTIHLRGASVVAVHAKTVPDAAGVATSPSLAPGVAATRARDVLARLGRADGVELSEPRLELFNRGLLQGVRYPTRLAWFVEARAIDLREFVWIDAHSGGVLLHFSQLTDALDRSIYTANSSSALPGTLARSEGQAATGDGDIDKAYAYAGDTYDYYLTAQGRDSYDGAGAPLISTTHYCPTQAPEDCPYPNAFWNGTQMVYGEGFASADDVDAHELTHAVTERTAGLYYYMQSGALNESFSDIFGETVDLTDGAGNDTPQVRWLCGEDLSIGAIRNMMNPNQFNDPAWVGDAYFVCQTPGNDRGGVHSNSGVPNHAYALMVDGGTYNSITVGAIGLTKAAKIEYRALTEYLVSSSDFADDSDALQQACADLIGTNGIAASDCGQVAKALDAVDLANPWPCLPSQASEPPVCGSAKSTVNLFFDQLENVTSGRWDTQLLSGAINPWNTRPFAGFPVPQGVGDFNLYSSGFASSGTHEFCAYDYYGASDSTVRMTGDLHLPANALAYFRHSYGFQQDQFASYDGGVVEYSTSGAGGPWVDAGSLIVNGARYGGTLSSSYGNPLGGRSAFVGESFGYTATKLDLSSLAGANLRFRFRLGTDFGYDDFGWFIDDVEIYTCGPTLFAGTFDDGTFAGWSSHVP